MAAVPLPLGKGKDLPLKLTSGILLTFKTSIFDLSPGGKHETHLDFSNDDNDITLRLILRRGHNRVFFNDRAHKSLVDGWGEERSVGLKPTDLTRWRRSGVTISVHDCSTASSDQYQILFDLKIVYYFNKRFSGPAVKVAYEEVLPDRTLLFNMRCPPQLSDPLETSSYTLDDLPVSEREAIELGRIPLAIPAPVPSTEISTSSPPHFIPNRPWARLSWDNGKHMRIYNLGPDDILQDYLYSESRNEWKRGNLHDLKIVLDPTSSLAAMGQWFYNVDISVYYQDPISDTICELRQGIDQTQSARQSVVVAAKGTSIAFIYEGPRIFYQDPQLHLRDCIYNPSLKGYHPGTFDSGVQPLGTPITAEVVHGTNVDVVINVMWKDTHGLPMRCSWTKSAGWDRLNPVNRGTGAWQDGQA